MIGRSTVYVLLGVATLGAGTTVLLAGDTAETAPVTPAWADAYAVTAARQGACGDLRPVAPPEGRVVVAPRGDALAFSVEAAAGPVAAPLLRAATLHAAGEDWRGRERFSVSEPDPDGAARCRATAIETRLERAGERIVVYRRIHESVVATGDACLDQPTTCTAELELELDPR
jgi:hypothetical protein